MNALTIVQPFAELIAAGVKRVENRTWCTGYRGALAIHAGKARTYNGRNVSDLARQYELDPEKLIFGAIVAVAELMDCVRTVHAGGRRRFEPADVERYPWLPGHEHAEGPSCLILANVRRLAHPIAIDGQQRFWQVRDDLIDRAVAGEKLPSQQLARTLTRRR